MTGDVVQPLGPRSLVKTQVAISISLQGWIAWGNMPIQSAPYIYLYFFGGGGVAAGSYGRCSGLILGPPRPRRQSSLVWFNLYKRLMQVGNVLSSNLCCKKISYNVINFNTKLI